MPLAFSAYQTLGWCREHYHYHVPMTYFNQNIGNIYHFVSEYSNETQLTCSIYTFHNISLIRSNIFYQQWHNTIGINHLKTNNFWHV